MHSGYTPDPINHVYSLPGKYISKKYFTYRSTQIFKIMFRGFFFKNPTKIWSSAQDHALLHLLLNTVGFFISAGQKSACRKWFVPQLYQLRRGILEGPSLKCFYMIYRVGTLSFTYNYVCMYACTYDGICMCTYVDEYSVYSLYVNEYPYLCVHM